MRLDMTGISKRTPVQTLDRQDFWDFCRYCSKHASKPVIQDFPAVMALADKGVCSAQTIFYPGHSAVMVAGSHIPANYQLIESRGESVIDIILGHHFKMWPIPISQYDAAPFETITQKIKRLSTRHQDSTIDSPLMCSEMWNAEHRQASYIINSVRAYEFVGSQWRTLWDYQLMDFFLRVPTSYRLVNVFTSTRYETASLPKSSHPWDKYLLHISVIGVRAKVSRSH